MWFSCIECFPKVRRHLQSPKKREGSNASTQCVTKTVAGMPLLNYTRMFLNLLFFRLPSDWTQVLDESTVRALEWATMLNRWMFPCLKRLHSCERGEKSCVTRKSISEMHITLTGFLFNVFRLNRSSRQALSSNARVLHLLKATMLNRWKFSCLKRTLVIWEKSYATEKPLRSSWQALSSNAGASPRGNSATMPDRCNYFYTSHTHTHTCERCE